MKFIQKSSKLVLIRSGGRVVSGGGENGRSYLTLSSSSSSISSTSLSSSIPTMSRSSESFGFSTDFSSLSSSSSSSSLSFSPSLCSSSQSSKLNLFTGVQLKSKQQSNGSTMLKLRHQNSHNQTEYPAQCIHNNNNNNNNNNNLHHYHEKRSQQNNNNSHKYSNQNHNHRDRASLLVRHKAQPNHFPISPLLFLITILHMASCDSIYLPSFPSPSFSTLFVPHHHPSSLSLPGFPSPASSYHLNECEHNVDQAIDLLLDQMRIHLPEEKITVQNGAITIYDARITRFGELIRLKSSCARKMDAEGVQVLLPFEAEIRTAQVSAKLKYNFYVTDIYGDYSANFSHIRMNGTLEANLEQEWMSVSQFNITSSQVVSDSIVFGYVPRWILEWVRSYFDNDNTQMYQQLAKLILQKEADNFRHYDLVRELIRPPSLVQGREEEDRGPLNRL